MESEKLNELNRQINEIKKRILLAGENKVLNFLEYGENLRICIFLEGQKTANAAEWQKQNRINIDTIGTLKKDIKESTVKVSRLRNPLQRPVVIKEPSAEPRKKQAVTPTIIVGKATYPIGAKNAEDALFLTDLKITENRKQLDLVRHRFKMRQQHLSKLVERYRELVANKEAQNQNLGEKPPETLEEDANRKVKLIALCHVRDYTNLVTPLYAARLSAGE